MSTLFSIPGSPDDESFGGSYRNLWNCVKMQPENGVLRAAFATVTQYMNGHAISAQEVRAVLERSSGMAKDLRLLRAETVKQGKIFSADHAGLLKGVRAICRLFKEIELRQKEDSPFPDVLCRKLMTQNGVPATANFVTGPLSVVDVVVAMSGRPPGIGETPDESFYLSYMQLRAAVQLGPQIGPRSIRLKGFLADATEFTSTGHIDEEQLGCDIEIARDMSLTFRLQQKKAEEEGQALSADRQRRLAGIIAASALFDEIKRRQEAGETLTASVRKDILTAAKRPHLRLVI